MTSLVARSVTLCNENSQMVEATRARITLSWRIRNGWTGLRGGADGESLPLADEPESVQWRLDEVTRVVRDKLARDALFPLLSSHCWAGPPTGQICVVCCRAIVAATQCEIECPQGVVYAHFTCQGVWLRESQHQGQHPHPQKRSRDGLSLPLASASRIQRPTSTEPPLPHSAIGVVYIDLQKSSSPQSPSAFLLSFGGATDGVGTFSLGRAVGLDPLATFLKRIGVLPADVDTALDALAAHQRHRILNVTVTPEVLRELGS